jgi:hypothetical protein
VTRLQIKIKDEDKAIIVFNLLKELPFVEIEQTEGEKIGKPIKRGEGSLAELFGLWKDRAVSLGDIRKKAWARSHDTL